MERIYETVANVRRALFCQSRTHAAKNMDPIIRSALAQTVEEDAVVCHDEMEQVETELNNATKALKESEEKEKFIGVRYYKYRKALDVTAKNLQEERKRIQQQQEQEHDDEEKSSNKDALLQDLEKRIEKWEKDEDALKSIQETHKQIMANCETIRRTVRTLEKKKADINRLNNQCQDFLNVANNDNNNNDNNNNQQETAVIVESELTVLPNSEHNNYNNNNDNKNDDNTHDEEIGQKDVVQ